MNLNRLAYCIAMTFISIKVFLVDVLEILNVLRIESMDGMCIAARAPAVTMISGSLFHPRALISSSSDLYLSRFWSMISGENLPLQ